MNIDTRKDLGLNDTGGGCACCAVEVPVLPSRASAVTSEVMVSGMTCSGCVKSVTEALTRIDGVESVSVDLTVGAPSRVTIRGARLVDQADVIAAVADAGYNVTPQG